MEVLEDVESVPDLFGKFPLLVSFSMVIFWYRESTSYESGGDCKGMGHHFIEEVTLTALQWGNSF